MAWFVTAWKLESAAAPYFLSMSFMTATWMGWETALSSMNSTSASAG